MPRLMQGSLINAITFYIQTGRAKVIAANISSDHYLCNTVILLFEQSFKSINNIVGLLKRKLLRQY